MRNSTQNLKPFSKLELWLDKRVYPICGLISAIGGGLIGNGVVQVLVLHRTALGYCLVALGVILCVISFSSIPLHYRIKYPPRKRSWID